MATFKTTRKYRHAFTFRWKDGEQKQSAECWAEYRIKPQDELEREYQQALDDSANQTANEALLSVILADFGGLEMQDGSGNDLTGRDRVKAARKDPTLAAVLVIEYNQGRSNLALGDEGNGKPRT